MDKSWEKYLEKLIDFTMLLHVYIFNHFYVKFFNVSAPTLRKMPVGTEYEVCTINYKETFNVLSVCSCAQYIPESRPEKYHLSNSVTSKFLLIP